MGTAGVLMPPKGYFEKLQKVLDKHDILFIADEVITGFGRTGHWFSTGGMKLRPDIVTLAKGITSAYFPVSASVISEKIWNVLEGRVARVRPGHARLHLFRPSGRRALSALTNLDIMEREGLVEQAADVGAYLLKALTERVGAHPHVGEVRGAGQMIAVEFIADKARAALLRS